MPNELTLELKKQLEVADREAKEARKAFDDAREKAVGEHGAEKIVADKELFEPLDQLNKNYGEKAETAEQIRARLMRTLDWDGNGDGKDNPPRPDENGGTKGGNDLPDLPNPGELFINSAEYKAMVDSGALNSDRAPVRMSPVKAMTSAEFKAVVTGLSRTSAGAFIINQRLPGYYGILLRQPRVAQLVTVSEAVNDTVEWVQETTFTNAAAETAEATSVADGLKPESTVALSVVNTPVQQIAHYMNVTRRALGDVAQIRDLINAELERGINLRLDTQMINGNGTSPNLKGILNVAGIGTQARGTDSRADAIRKAMTSIRLNFIEPNAVLMHPTDVQTLVLEKNANGQYFYGNPGDAVSATPRVWGLSIVESPVIAQGTALVGDFTQAYLWVRDGLQILTSENVSDFFLRNIITLLAEGRFAFGVPRPAAFSTVTSM